LGLRGVRGWGGGGGGIGWFWGGRRVQGTAAPGAPTLRSKNPVGWWRVFSGGGGVLQQTKTYGMKIKKGYKATHEKDGQGLGDGQTK